MDNHAKIIYTGETDVLFSQWYLSLTLGSANLSESVDAEYNKDREQDCFNNGIH